LELSGNVDAYCCANAEMRDDAMTIDGEGSSGDSPQGDQGIAASQIAISKKQPVPPADPTAMVMPS